MRAYKYLIIGLSLTSIAKASEQLAVVPENVRQASTMISNGEQRQNGDPVANYQGAIRLLAKPGKMKPDEMLLLARAYSGLGYVLHTSNSSESKDYFNRAMVILEQIPQQVKRDAERGISQAEAKQNEYTLSKSLEVWQQVKNGLSIVG